jgi:hypothetical protein
MPLLVSTQSNVTALVLAAANGKTAVVKLLLDRGANPVTQMDGATSAALMRTTDAVMLLRDAAARRSGQAASGAQAPGQPAPASTSYLAGLYQSERVEALAKGKSLSAYRYLRLSCDGRVLELSLGGEGTKSEIATVNKAFDKGVGGSGTYQIQETAMKFSIQSPSGTVDYQGQMEGTALNLDSHSQINGHRGHDTFHLVQPGQSCPSH